MAQSHKAVRAYFIGKRAQCDNADQGKETLVRHLHVLDKLGFGSRQHYWAVKVKDKTTGDSEKQSWYVGLARDGRQSVDGPFNSSERLLASLL